MRSFRAPAVLLKGPRGGDPTCSSPSPLPLTPSISGHRSGLRHHVFFLSTDRMALKAALPPPSDTFLLAEASSGTRLLHRQLTRLPSIRRCHQLVSRGEGGGLCPRVPASRGRTARAGLVGPSSSDTWAE